MFGQKKVKFVFLTSGIVFLASFVMTPCALAVRNPDERVPSNSRENTRESRSAALKTAVRPVENRILASVKLLEPEQASKPASLAVIRNLNDLSKLNTVLPQKPQTETDIKNALLTLLRQSPAWFEGVKVSQLRLDYIKIIPSIDNQAKDAYVRFVQTYEGNDIEGSFVSFALKIFPDWTIIVSAQAQLYPVLNIKTTAGNLKKLSEEAIHQKSLKSLRLEGQNVHKRLDRKKVRFIDGQWRVVREIQYKENVHKLLIDENTQKIWAQDTRVYGTIGGKVQGRGVEFNPVATAGNLSNLDLKDLKVTLSNANNLYTDASGNFNFPSETSDTNVSAKLLGRWAVVYSIKNDDLSLIKPAVLNVPLTLTFNPTGSAESATAQVNGYYHTTFIHDWMQSRLAPNPLSALDYSFPVYVNINDTCNAYYDGFSINFYSSGDGCINSAYDTVIYHEYGHFVDDMIGGLTDGGLSEGWGDIVAAFATGQPVIGEGFFGGSGYIRSANNTYQYPADGNDEVHYLGQAWAGFAWDLRKNLIASLGQTAGVLLAENLIIPTFYANSLDIPTAVLDVLIRDDNDATLGNLTPHYAEIIDAANKHSIPLPDADFISPSAVNDLHVVNRSVQSITLGWTASGDDGGIGVASSYDIRYSFSPIVTDQDFDAATAIVSAPIPLPPGVEQLVHLNNPEFNKTYYFAMKVADNVKNMSPLSNVVSTIIKARELLSENFETGAIGWASIGLWHFSSDRFNSPSKSFAYNNGTDYDTGARNSGSLITPSMTIAPDAKDIVVHFKQWIYTENSPLFDKRSIEISIDDEATWIPFELNYNVAHKQWIADSAVFSSYAGKTVKFRFFFDTMDDIENYGEGWYVDDVKIYVTQPPVLAPIGPKNAYTQTPFQFHVSGLDPNDAPLTYSVNGLPSGATFENNIFQWTPGETQQGPHSVEFIVSNGILSASETVSINVAKLAVMDLTMRDFSGPTNGLTGTPLTVTDTVKNEGTAASGSFYVGYYLSKDPLVTTADTLIGVRLLNALGAGASSTTSTTHVLPSVVNAGTYYFGAIADFLNKSPEINESNNVIVGNMITLAPGADLVMKTITASAVAVAGSQITITDTVANEGPGKIGSFYVRYYLSRDPIITVSDITLGSRWINVLAGGASNTASTNFNVPLTVAPRTYYLGAIADYSKARPEQNESNNTISRNIVIVK